MPRKNNEIQQALQAGFIVSTYDWMPLENQWWRHCDENKLPFIVIRKGRTLTKVELDMLPTGRKLSTDSIHVIHGVARQVPRPGVKWMHSPLFAKVEGVPLELAEFVAHELKRLAEELAL